jgi:hypothetical protein
VVGNDGVIDHPADSWRFRVLRFKLMVQRGSRLRPQASEGEAQHGPFCWTRRFLSRRRASALLMTEAGLFGK